MIDELSTYGEYYKTIIINHFELTKTMMTVKVLG